MKKYESIEIFYREIIFIGFLFGPKIHPILKDEKGIYYELDKKKGKIIIYTGKIKSLGKLTRLFFNKKRKPKKVVKVDKKEFLKAINKFKKLNQGKTYHLLNFSTNCIGFKNFVIKKSQSLIKL